ncbi:uncharacterized protein GBIM_01938, partial [Gryllus bimaculatus]
ELCDEPQLFVDGACRYDVVQGALGNCWSMAVVPDGQILHGPGYSGCIVIRLWHMNHWRDVEIDDRLPVQHDEPLYGRSSCKNEFWMSLVEKAFAKFHGGYENLNSGQLTEGFINLTGYSVRSIEFSEEEFKDGSKRKNEFFKHLRKEIDNRSLIACARAGEFQRGLPGFHGYTVTGAHHVRRVRQRLVRVRNPWGDDEWTGKWRDDHDIWKELGADVLEELDYKVHVDGEFWMKFSDFLKMFQEVCIGSRQPSIHEDKYLPATEEKVIREFWTEDTAGGPFGTDSFYCNPQILLDAVALRTEAASPEVDSAEDDADVEAAEAGAERPGRCTEDARCAKAGVPVLVELLQDHNRRLSKDLLTIDFRVFKIYIQNSTIRKRRIPKRKTASIVLGCERNKQCERCVNIQNIGLRIVLRGTLLHHVVSLEEEEEEEEEEEKEEEASSKANEKKKIRMVVGEAAVAAVDAGERLSRLQLQEECEQEAQTGSEEACSAAHAFCHLQHCARYVVVPHTGEPGERRRFLLRVFGRNAHLHLRLLQDQAQVQDQAQGQDQDQGKIQAQEQTQL